MSLYEYRLIAGGWGLMMIFLTVFWYFTLRRLAEVMKAHLESTRSRETVPGFTGMFLYLFRGEFKKTKDEKYATICRRLRQLLYGYVGGIGAYVVFLAVMRPHY